MTLNQFSKYVGAQYIQSGRHPTEAAMPVHDWRELLDEVFSLRRYAPMTPDGNTPDLDDVVILGVRVHPAINGFLVTSAEALAEIVRMKTPTPPGLTPRYEEINLGPYRYAAITPRGFRHL